MESSVRTVHPREFHIALVHHTTTPAPNGAWVEAMLSGSGI